MGIHVWERSVAKSYHYTSLLSSSSKLFEMVNNKPFLLLEKCGPFCDFYFCFRSSLLSSLLAAVADRFARAFNVCHATQALLRDK